MVARESFQSSWQFVEIPVKDLSGKFVCGSQPEIKKNDQEK